MSLVRFDTVTKRFAGVPVLEGVSLQIEEGEKVGLIGRNGGGKSTIFRLMTGEIQADEGGVERMRRARIACLRQLPDVPATTPLWDITLRPFSALIEMEGELRALEERMAAGDERVVEPYGTLQERFTIAGGYEYRARARRVLTGLGFSDSEFELPFSALSGGQRTRLMLALVLLEDADLLLLDEPENHLDISAREWLESFLKSWPRSFVIISHDREMLNAVPESILELDGGTVKRYAGNYDAFVEAKALAIEQQQKAFSRQQDFIRREEAWINRFRYKNTKARAVQSRVKRLNKMERVDAPTQSNSAPRFNLGEVVRTGEIVLSCEHLSMGYENLPLYSDVSFEVQRGERIGIIGPNGSGKTTLLRHIMGNLPEGTGTVRLGHKVALGYYDQQHASLNEDNDIFTEVQQVAPAMQPVELRKFLGRFLFTGEDVFKTIKTLSGGERSRVALAKLVLDNNNVLLLDEPTNHLDIPAREMLDEALDGYPGTLIVVSHDRALIDRLATKLVVFKDGTATVHLGNYSDYRWRQQSQGAVVEDAREEKLSIRKDRAKMPGKAAERARRKSERRLEEVEDRIEDMEGLIAAYDAKFADADPADYERLNSLQEEYEAMRADLKDLYSEWESLSEELSR